MSDNKFIKIKCRDCSEERIVFERSTSQINCDVCGATLAKPSGGKAKLFGDIVEKLV